MDVGTGRGAVKSVRAFLVTDQGEQPAVLTLGEASWDEAVLVVDGRVISPEDLPASAYLKVDDQEMADLAVVAGYATEPPKSAKRRRHRKLGRVYAVLLLVGALGSLYNVVREVVELDLLGALMWLGLALFTAALAAIWWLVGENIGLEEDARRRIASVRFWRAVKGLGRPKRQKR